MNPPRSLFLYGVSTHPKFLELVRVEHVFRVECLVKFLLGHQFLLEDDVIDGTIGVVSLLGNLRASLVT